MAKNNKQDEPLLSVCMITYNHEAYIKKAIEGVLMQKAYFRYILIIGEDFSSDKTRLICEEYANKYPEKISLLPSERNVGMMPNFIRTLEACRGKYIALCEGDDYWVDQNKLNIQVKFLEDNPDFVLCHHNANIVDNDGKILIDGYLPDKHRLDQDSLTLMTEGNVITNTLVFRNLIKVYPPQMLLAKNGDTFLLSLLGEFGGGKFISDINNGAYRWHPGGIYSTSSSIKRALYKEQTWQCLVSYYKSKNDRVVINKLESLRKSNLIGIFWVMFHNQDKYFFNTYKKLLLISLSKFELKYFLSLNKYLILFLTKLMSNRLKCFCINSDDGK